jgi:hypothetical protein
MGVTPWVWLPRCHFPTAWLRYPRPPRYSGSTGTCHQAAERSEHKVHEYIYRVPQCMSPCRNWDSPTPSLASECAPSPGTKGGHTRLRVRGWGSPKSDDWRNSLALCLLCGSEHSIVQYLYFFNAIASPTSFRALTTNIVGNKTVQ